MENILNNIADKLWKMADIPEWGHCTQCKKPHTSSPDDRYIFMNDKWCDKCNLKYEKLDYDEHNLEIDE